MSKSLLNFLDEETDVGDLILKGVKGTGEFIGKAAWDHKLATMGLLGGSYLLYKRKKAMDRAEKERNYNIDPKFKKEDIKPQPKTEFK